MTALPALGPRLVVATHNSGKLREFRELLAPFPLELTSAGELGLPEPDETGTTYAENAQIKAESAAKASGLPALADDSGLCVHALWGAPGLFSARWAGPSKDFAVAMRRVEEDLGARGATAAQDRRAAFVAALCLVWPTGERLDVEGHVAGGIVWPPRGALGFGYDPIFLPDGLDRTFGEIGSDEKHGVVWDSDGRATGLSHRARAFGKLVAALYPGGPPK
jgi:XTP/dITP diphosphohydrolase